MCFRINLIVCDFTTRAYCMFCCPAQLGSRLLPFIDFAEFVFHFFALIFIFTLQDTWFAHISLALAANTVATFLKLFAAPIVFCAPILKGQTKLVSSALM